MLAKIKYALVLVLCQFCLASLLYVEDSSASGLCVEKGNIYSIDKIKGKAQLTSAGEDYDPTASPDKKQIIFIRRIRESQGTDTASGSAKYHDEIWSMDANGSDQHSIVRNNYSADQDTENFLGGFYNLRFSVDSDNIYFLCQGSNPNDVLYSAHSDGSNIKKLGYAHTFEVIAGEDADSYYGNLVVGLFKKDEADKPERLVWVLLDDDAKEIKELKDIDAFWGEHQKLK